MYLEGVSQPTGNCLEFFHKRHAWAVREPALWSRPWCPLGYGESVHMESGGLPGSMFVLTLLQISGTERQTSSQTKCRIDKVGEGIIVQVLLNYEKKIRHLDVPKHTYDSTNQEREKAHPSFSPQTPRSAFLKAAYPVECQGNRNAQIMFPAHISSQFSKGTQGPKQNRAHTPCKPKAGE